LIERVFEVRAAADNLPWIIPHFDAISSDLSVFHRIDDVDDIGMPRFVRLLEHLHVYGGAYLASLQRAHATRTQEPERAPAADGDTPDWEIEAQWQAVMAREFPDDIGDGVERVSADEIAREFGG